MIARSFNDIRKDMSVGDGHVTTALGNQQSRRRLRRGGAFSLVGPAPKIMDFKSAMEASAGTVAKLYNEGPVAPSQGVQPGDVVSVSDSSNVKPGANWTGKVVTANGYKITSDHDRGLNVHDLPPSDLARVSRAPNGRHHWVFSKAAALRPMENDPSVAHSPFPYDPNALANMREDQVPRFFGALTEQDRLPLATVPLSDLTAMQNRVDPAKVQAMRGGVVTKPALVIAAHGRNYIADGHHRLSADYLDGKPSAQVRYLDLNGRSNALKRIDISSFDVAAAVKRIGPDIQRALDIYPWNVPLTIAKADPDKRLIFGWASVVEKNGQLVVDHQDDAIQPADLEDGAYDFVLFSRQQGDMHMRKGTGRLIESCVFTKEKQDAMGIRLPDDMVAWWVGFKVDDDGLWAAHKRGDRPEFSIGGTGRRVPYQP